MYYKKCFINPIVFSLKIMYGNVTYFGKSTTWVPVFFFLVYALINIKDQKRTYVGNFEKNIKMFKVNTNEVI